MYDAVIIGAGPSGLAAAARLSHFGVKVCLVEAHTRLGGLNSWHHVRGVEISSGLHAFTNYSPDGRGGALGKLLRQLRIRPGDLDLFPQKKSSIRFPSASLEFTNDPEFLRQQVAKTFPAAVDGFDRLRETIRNTDEGEFTSIQSSARDVVREHVADPLLEDMLLCPVMYYGNPGGVGDGRDRERARPDMDWLLFCVVWKCIFETGLACPAGGMRPLWVELAGRIRENEGEILTGLAVETINVSPDMRRVHSLTLADGREIRAKTVFSSAGMVETRRLLGDDELTEGIGRISVVEGISLLDQASAAAGMDDATVFYSLDDRLFFDRPDGLADRRGGVLCAMDNYPLPEAKIKRVLKSTRLASHPAWRALDATAYREAKIRVAGEMAEDMKKIGVDLGKAKNAPGVFGLFDDVFTPLTLERYTGHAGGALYGSPFKSRAGDTGLENLFLIGSDQGFHGIVGAMLSGVAMANRHYLQRFK